MKRNNKKYKDTSDHSSPIVPMPNIVTWSCPTKAGNSISVFYNRETNLLVVDLVSANEKGGNEIMRKELDEKSLLAHTR